VGVTEEKGSSRHFLPPLCSFPPPFSRSNRYARLMKRPPRSFSSLKKVYLIVISIGFFPLPLPLPFPFLLPFHHRPDRGARTVRRGPYLSSFARRQEGRPKLSPLFLPLSLSLFPFFFFSAIAAGLLASMGRDSSSRPMRTEMQAFHVISFPPFPFSPPFPPFSGA